ncbi:MAG: hypothetical protein PVI26_02295, partial [Chitinispirillia bacterium]
HTSPRFNTWTDDIFWHKNDIHKKIIKYFSKKHPVDLDNQIHENALHAKNVIKSFIEQNEIDLLIAHNTSHIFNFITAVGLGYYIEELRRKNIIWPKILVWWHDSYFERNQFSNPNGCIKKYLKYLPGTYVDGIVFINSLQPFIAKRGFQQHAIKRQKNFFRQRIEIIPNTSEITWKWKKRDWSDSKKVFPPQDNYNFSFFKDIGLLGKIKKHNMDLDNTVILLQHTRVIPRKKIELAIDFAFQLENRFLNDNLERCIVLLISGHSGDEQVTYKNFLNKYYKKLFIQHPNSRVILIFGEKIILSHRDIIVDQKYYKFAEIPEIISPYNCIGTYFSEIEGFGNNLLEMIAAGIPVVINKYKIYKTDIQHLGFQLPHIDNCVLTNSLVEEVYKILTNINYKNSIIKNNLQVLEQKLSHKIIARKLGPLIQRIFTRTLVK